MQLVLVSIKPAMLLLLDLSHSVVKEFLILRGLGAMMVELKFANAKRGTFLLIFRPKKSMIDLGLLIQKYLRLYEQTKRICLVGN